MKRSIFFKASKTVLIVTLLLTLVFNMASTKINAVSPTIDKSLQPDPTTLVYVDPAVVRKNPGEKFNVSITVADVVKLNTVEVWLSWSPRLLNFTKVLEGPFLGSGGGSTLPIINKYQDAGYIVFGDALVGGDHVNGTGVVLIVEFLVETTGKTYLTISNDLLIRPDFTAIPHQKSDGYFFNLPTRVYVDPAANSADVLQSFAINVTVGYVMDLYSWQLNLTWRADVLNATNVTEGPFLGSDGTSTQFYYQQSTFQNATGKYESLYANSTRLGAPSGVNVNGTILAVTFLVEKRESTTLDINQDFLYDSSKVAISHLTYDGIFTPVSISVMPHRNTARFNASFTIDIEISNATDLYSWQLNLTWRADVLAATNATEGPFLKSGGATAFNATIDNAAGAIFANSTLLGAGSGVNGTGIVANVTFLVKAFSDRTVLDLVYTKLLDSKKVQIIHISVGGVFSNIPPTADFRYSPLSPAANRTVSFDAAVSYDLDPDGYIVNYKWDFGDGNVTTLTNPIVDHTYINIGSFNVNLTVTDNDGLNGTTTKSVTVKRESTLTISASPTAITLGESTTITGTLDPVIPMAPIEIYGRLVGVASWGPPLQVPNTNTSSQYSYVWQPTIAGTYEVRANFTGDTTTLPSGSPTITVTVNKAASTITASASPTTITYGQNTTLTGSIIPAISNAAATIWYRKSGTQTFINLTTVRTNDNSQFKYVWTPPSAGTYQIKANWTGDTNSLPAESSIVAIIVNKIGSTLTISVSPRNITNGESTTISGSITPTKVNFDVIVQYRKAGETAWNNIATVRTNQNSQFSQTWTPQGAGTYEVRAIWNGDENTSSDESDVQVVQVTEAPASNIFLYAAIGVGLILVVALLIYFLKIRKPK